MHATRACTHTQVAAHTHYMPESWRGHAHRESVKLQVTRLFPYKAQLFVQELLGVLVG
jgi:autophagy-related protein 9